VRTPEALWLDFSGVSALRIPMPTDSAGDEVQQDDPRKLP
jgi:hypothetical protein